MARAARVTREQYFDAALEVLADSGFSGLTIGVMCKRFGVTSGSFYHHFGSWPSFVDALLEYWENRQVEILRERHFGEGNPAADVKMLQELTLGLNHRAEAAIRAWGANDDTVRRARMRVDDARRRTVQKAIQRVVGHRDTAREITSLGMSMLVGYQQTAGEQGHVTLDKLLDEYVLLIGSFATSPAVTPSRTR